MIIVKNSTKYLIADPLPANCNNNIYFILYCTHKCVINSIVNQSECIKVHKNISEQKWFKININYNITLGMYIK